MEFLINPVTRKHVSVNSAIGRVIAHYKNKTELMKTSAKVTKKPRPVKKPPAK